MNVTQGLFEFNWDFLFSIITFLALFAVLKHFFFQKVHDYMEARSQSVEDTLNRAKKKTRRANRKLADYEEKLAGAEEERRQIIADAGKQAREQADRIIDDANKKAQETLDHARSEIEREQEAARRTLRREVGELAVQAAGKILEKELKPEDHREIIDRVLDETGAVGNAAEEAAGAAETGSAAGNATGADKE